MFRECASEPLQVNAQYPVEELGTQSLQVTCEQSVNLTWLPPAEGQVDSYFVECRSAVDVINKTVASGILSSVLGPLAGGIQYTCSVAAVNVFGVGPSSSAKTFETS